MLVCNAFSNSLREGFEREPTNWKAIKLQIVNQMLIVKSFLRYYMRDMIAPLSSPLCAVFSGTLDTQSSSRSNIVVRNKNWDEC